MNIYTSRSSSQDAEKNTPCGTSTARTHSHTHTQYTHTSGSVGALPMKESFPQNNEIKMCKKEQAMGVSECSGSVNSV